MRSSRFAIPSAWVIATLLSAGLLLTSPVAGAPNPVTRYVGPGGGTGGCESPTYAAIASAVDAANAGDTIHVCAGTYLLTTTVTAWKSLSFVGDGAAITIVDGQSSVGLFYVDATTTFSGLTLRNGRSWQGGAIHAGGDVTLTDCRLSGNVASSTDGGAVFAMGSVFVTGSVFSGNSADGRGGAIRAFKVVMSGTTLTSNAARFGGAVYLIGPSSIDMSTFTANDGYDGGAVYVDVGGSVTVAGSEFTGNTATDNGGAVSASMAATVTATESTFSDNTAAVGGGAIHGFTVTASRDTFARNTAAAGGALGSTGGTMTVTNSTFTANRATRSGGAVDGTGFLVATNSTFADDTAPSGSEIGFSTATFANDIVGGGAPGTCSVVFPHDVGGNLATDATCGFTDASSRVVSLASLALGPLADNGGPTWTIAIGPMSMAVEAGINTVCAGPPVGGIDQRGVTRPQAARCDSGAYERITPAPVVTGISPTIGPVGTAVTIAGSGLTGATAVDFVHGAAPFSVVDDDTITAWVPEGTFTGPVAVTTPGGTAVSPVDFTVVPRPTISSFAPAAGPVGTVVTIVGTGFSGTTAVACGGTTAAYTVVSSTQIRASVPLGATSGPITVTTPGGTASSVGRFVLTLAPVVSAFSPAAGRAGTAVVVTGYNLGYVRSLTIGGRAAAFSIRSPGTIVATVPAGAITGPIVVTSPFGSSKSATSFYPLP